MRQEIKDCLFDQRNPRIRLEKVQKLTTSDKSVRKMIRKLKSSQSSSSTSFFKVYNFFILKETGFRPVLKEPL